MLWIPEPKINDIVEDKYENHCKWVEKVRT